MSGVQGGALTCQEEELGDPGSRLRVGCAREAAGGHQGGVEGDVHEEHGDRHRRGSPHQVLSLEGLRARASCQHIEMKATCLQAVPSIIAAGADVRAWSLQSTHAEASSSDFWQA